MSGQAVLDFEAPEKGLPERLRFSGGTFVAAFDEARLGGQMLRVWAFVRDGEWHTLAEIAWAARKPGRARSEPEASVSARLRDLRNKYGFDVQHRRKGDPKDGLFEYRVVKP